jgi:hypothetical protein
MALIRPRNHQIAERALNMRHACSAAVEQHIPAEIASPTEAVRASETRSARIDGHRIAERQALDLGANLRDLARDLMTEDHRLLECEIANPSFEVVGKIGTADASRFDRDPHLIGSKGRRCYIGQAKISGGVDL